MSPPIERLRGIKTLPQLLAYLRDELDWPIESDDAENVTFDYDASELGLDEKSAVRIKEIKQLRPLSGNQPWGIFFVNFEKKALPVMVMRRILRSLVFNKRTAAGKSERQAWNASDLLFVSSYGEEDDRAITFAHFVEDEDLGGLAELRVLGWDDDDTPLKYDYVAHTLHEKLRWRDDYERRPEEWRSQWRSAFELRHLEVITTSKQLALSLAELAKKIRARVRAVLRYEDGFGQVRKLEAAFRAALIHDLSEDDFADMYAQTITYGLFSAAVSRPAGIHGDNIVDMVPVTNPFLRDMLKTFLHLNGRKGRIDFDELGIQEVTSLLNSPNTHLDAVLRDFDNRNPQEDPVIHFYELFLSAYDMKKKVQRGVFYTPKPVVSYIVRSVHELLQKEFKLEHGLADTMTWGEMLERHPSLSLPTTFDDKNKEHRISANEPFVQILDPATGTATFLVEVIDVIHRHLESKWKKAGFKAMPTLPTTSFPRQPTDLSQYWNQYVALSLLPRLHGYELMMAPYAIAHMKIGLKLWETGYRFGTEERARIYLTNALEPWIKQLRLPDVEALAHEATAVNEIKRHKRFTVVIGNPPYSNYSQLNTNPWIVGLLDDYKQGLGERKLNLDDDFIKFLRMSQSTLDRTGVGTLGMITNHTYLEGVTHRQMRSSLLSSFNRHAFLDLHGNTRKAEGSACDTKDENVFDIQQGVAISLHSKCPFGSENHRTEHAHLWGSRETKYRRLEQEAVESTVFIRIEPSLPYFFFAQIDLTGEAEYKAAPSVVDIFPSYGCGFATSRDAFVTDFDREPLSQRIESYFNTNASEEILSKEFRIRSYRAFSVADYRKQHGFEPSRIVRFFYRPFDEPWVYYAQNIVQEWQRKTMRHLGRRDSLALITARLIKGETPNHCFVSRLMVEKISLSNKTSNNAFAFPLYLYAEDSAQGALSLNKHRAVNLSPKFLAQLAARLELKQPMDDGLPAGLTPEDIFHYAYAMFHSPGYRSRYAEFLKIDFPRVPLTGNLELFRALARHGGELTALHLLESPKLNNPRSGFICGRNPAVEKISWLKNTVRIDKAQTAGFEGVSEAIWNFHVGGYQVCEKWLKDRKGRPLSRDDIAHYHKIVVALAETIRLMAEIDKTIEKHGGWPGAFALSAQLPQIPNFERVALANGRNYWLEFTAAAIRTGGGRIRLPLLWEAHLVALQPKLYESEISSVIGENTKKWLASLAKEPVESGLFSEVLQTLVENNKFKRDTVSGEIFITAVENLPIAAGEWRIFDVMVILQMLAGRPEVVTLEKGRVDADPDYVALREIWA